MKQKMRLMTLFYNPAALTPEVIGGGTGPITEAALVTGLKEWVRKGGIVRVSHIEVDLVRLACSQNGSPPAYKWVGVTFVPRPAGPYMKPSSRRKRQMHMRQSFSLGGFIAASFLVFMSFAGRTQAQVGGQNPTPIIITLTPVGSPTPGGQPTAVPGPTESALPADRFEPNNDPQTATALGWQTEPGLTLAGADVDYFTGYLKAGQLLRLSTTVYAGLDTRLKLYWDGQLMAENDDRSPADVGSTVTFTAPADSWYIALVEKATVYDGLYDLETALVEPTATPTAAPTLTPTPIPDTDAIAHAAYAARPG